MDEVLKRILEAESEARKIVDNAYEEARRIEAEARSLAEERARAVYDEIMRGAEEEAEREVKKVEEEMAQEIKRIEERMLMEMGKLESLASKNLEKALKLLLMEALRP
jgi:vacuolar-type H+-ATPase subunit H